MVKTCLLLDAYNLAGVAQVLAPSCSLRSALVHSLVLFLFVSLGLFLLLGLPLDGLRMVQSLVIEIVRNGQEDVQYLAVALA